MSAKVGSADSDVLLVKTVNGVTTLTMNRPDKLNGWTRPMMTAIKSELLRMSSMASHLRATIAAVSLVVSILTVVLPVHS